MQRRSKFQTKNINTGKNVIKNGKKCKIKAFFLNLSNIDMAYFFQTKLSNIGHFFQIGNASVKLVSVYLTICCMLIVTVVVA